MDEEVKVLIEKYIGQYDALAEAELNDYREEIIDRHIKLARGYYLALQRILGYETDKAIQLYVYSKINSHYIICPSCNGEGIYSHYDDCPGHLVHDRCSRCKGLGKLRK